MFKNEQGQDCVNYQTSLPVNNQMQIVTGVACQQADGKWKTVSK